MADAKKTTEVVENKAEATATETKATEVKHTEAKATETKAAKAKATEAKATEATEAKAEAKAEPKAEAHAEPKADARAPFAMPFLQPQHFSTWTHWMNDQVTRMGTAYAEFAKFEAQRVEQAKAAVDEIARLTKASLDYGMQMSNEFRRVTLDAAKKTVEQVSRPASH